MQRALGILLVAALAVPAGATERDAAGVSLGLGPKAEAGALVKELSNQLQSSFRFQVLAPVPPPTGPWTDKTLQALRGQTKARYLIVGALRTQGTETHLVCRLVDLKLGDVSKDLRFRGASADLQSLAGSLVRTLRSRAPISTSVKALGDGTQILLDAGRQDGVIEGSLFRIRRRATDREPFATARVLKVEEWHSIATLEPASSSAGPVRIGVWDPHPPMPTRLAPAPGDLATEDAALGLLN